LRGVGDAPITQYEFARAGIITKEMIYVASARTSAASKMLERAEAAIADGESFGAATSPPSSRRNSCATRSRAAAPSSPPTSTTPNSSR
jgi:phosphomethylpyrimidine synthase